MKNTNIAKKICSVGLTIIAWLSFFAAVFLCVAVIFASLSSTDTSNGRPVFGHRLLIVNSDSMSKSELSQNEPIFFTTNDLIVIKEIDNPSDIAVGDVITFISCNPDSAGEVISHKVRSIKRTDKGDLLGFETYGINTGVSDLAVVEPSAVIGKYVFKISNLANMFRFFKQPAGFFTAILIPCLLLLIFYSIRVGKQIARREMEGNINDLKNKMSNMGKEGVIVPDTNQNESFSAEKAMELSFKTLSTTIESLTRTIESLAENAEKPVESLVRTVEVLSGAAPKAVQPEPEPQPDQELVTEDSTNEENPPFNKELFLLKNEKRVYFGEIHNEITSYKKVSYRISNKGIFYALGNQIIAKATIKNDTLKFYTKMNSSAKSAKNLFFAIDISSSNAKDNVIRMFTSLANSYGLTKEDEARLLKNKKNIFEILKLYE